MGLGVPSSLYGVPSNANKKAPVAQKPNNASESSVGTLLQGE